MSLIQRDLRLAATRLYDLLPETFNGKPPEHDPIVGGQCARLLRLKIQDAYIRDPVARVWIGEASSAIVARGMLTAGQVSRALGLTESKPKQLSLF